MTDTSPTNKMDIQLAEQISIPDSYFWYTLSIVLAAALIGIIWRFAERVSKTLEILKDTVNELKSITRLQENVSENHHDRLEKLEDVVYLVRYEKK